MDMDMTCAYTNLEDTFPSASAMMMPEARFYAMVPPPLLEARPASSTSLAPLRWPTEQWTQVCDPSTIMPYHQANTFSSPDVTPREPSPESWYNNTTSSAYSPSLYASSVYSSSPIESSPTINYDDPHWTRTQLISRVMQLEQERRLQSNPVDPAITFEPGMLSLKEHMWPLPGPVPCTSSPPSTLCPGTLRQSSPGGIYTCRWSNCLLELATLQELIGHISQDHIGSGKPAYYCEWQDCPRQNKPFMKRHKMHNHMRTHTGERPFACNVKGCEKRFSRLDSLNTHVRTHSNIRPFACDIPGCSKAYFHSRSLRKHLKSHLARDKKSRTKQRHRTSISSQNSSDSSFSLS